MADAYISGAEPEQVRYDVCIVFPRKSSKTLDFNDDEDLAKNRKLTKPSDKQMQQMQIWEATRIQTIESLRNCGLQIYCYHSRDRDAIYCKVGADTEKLKKAAIATKHKLQLNDEYKCAWAPYRADFPGMADKGFKDKRTVSHLYKRYPSADQQEEDGASFASDRIFKTTDRLVLINYIITSGDKDCAGVKIGQLEYKGDVLHYFALHEEKAKNELAWNWKQPGWLTMKASYATSLRDYFGARVSFYFIWMAFYWKWLALPSIIGVLLSLWDIIVGSDDNAADIPYCVFLSLWATYLPHFWRREEAKHSIEWGTLDMTPDFEACRHEHVGELKMSPITNQIEPCYPWKKRIPAYMLSTVVVGTLMVTVIVGMLMVFVMRHFMHNEFPGGKLTFQIILAVCVQFTNWGLGIIARKLTEKENHRSTRDFDTHCMVKGLLFKFVNCYGPLYYIAFFKRYSPTLKCSENDCFVDLQWQLAVFVIVRVSINNFFEWVQPRLKIYWAKRGANTGVPESSPAERQAKMEKFTTFGDYDEVLITHGYAVFFAVACPWVTALVLVATIGEIFLDVNAAMVVKRRPIPEACRNNEPWDSAFEVFGIIGAITNMSLIIFGSEEYEGWRLTEKMVLFVLLEHSVVLCNMFLRQILPAVPSCVSGLSMRHESIVNRVFGGKSGGVNPAEFGGMYGDRGGGNFEIMANDLEDDDDNDAPMLSMAEAKGDFAKGMKDGLLSMKGDVFGGKSNK